jgi:hypothetical protein
MHWELQIIMKKGLVVVAVLSLSMMSFTKIPAGSQDKSLMCSAYRLFFGSDADACGGGSGVCCASTAYKFS